MVSHSPPINIQLCRHFAKHAAATLFILLLGLSICLTIRLPYPSYIQLSITTNIMKFNTIAITALSIIASATQVNARRRHLTTIKGDESDASMSYMLSPARGSSKSKSATGSPTGSPTGSRKFQMIHVVVHIMCSKQSPSFLFLTYLTVLLSFSRQSINSNRSSYWIAHLCSYGFSYWVTYS